MPLPHAARRVVGATLVALAAGGLTPRPPGRLRPPGRSPRASESAPRVRRFSSPGGRKGSSLGTASYASRRAATAWLAAPCGSG